MLFGKPYHQNATTICYSVNTYTIVNIEQELTQLDNYSPLHVKYDLNTVIVYLSNHIFSLGRWRGLKIGVEEYILFVSGW